jgi:hypothetical protein
VHHFDIRMSKDPVDAKFRDMLWGQSTQSGDGVAGPRIARATRCIEVGLALTAAPFFWIGGASASGWHNDIRMLVWGLGDML